MGIVSALDSCDEQDIIYALSDGFSEIIQEDNDEILEKDPDAEI